MKTLYENILASTKSGKDYYIQDIKKLIKSSNPKDEKKLQKLWDNAGLGVDGFKWTIDSVGVHYVFDFLIVITNYNASEKWDLEITRNDFDEKLGKKEREELIEKLEKSGHFIIDKSQIYSNHWLAKII
jgi:hypothetical protein